MKGFSQNDEEEIICNYFKEFKGHLLDIGANDGETLSNSRRLILEGWTADLVEPSPSAYNRLIDLYATNDKVFTHNYAVSDTVGWVNFFDSKEHLGKGDTSLLSTINEHDYNKWCATTEYETIKVYSVDFNTLLKDCKQKTFDFISIDAEGVDLLILKQIDLSKVECKMVCVEHNGINIIEYIDYIRSFGLKLIHTNAENLIMAK